MYDDGANNEGTTLLRGRDVPLGVGIGMTRTYAYEFGVGASVTPFCSIFNSPFFWRCKLGYAGVRFGSGVLISMSFSSHLDLSQGLSWQAIDRLVDHD
jgi:hypothetical protein